MLRTRFVWMLVCVSLMTSLTSPACMAGAEAAPEVRQHAAPVALLERTGVRPALVEEMARGKRDRHIPITIVLRDQLPDTVRASLARTAGKASRRAVIVDELRARAKRSRGSVMRVLETERQAGNVGPVIRPLWIANAVATTATQDAIEQLAAHPDVAHVNYDRPVAREVLTGATPGVSAPDGPGSIECGTDLIGSPQVWSDCGVTGAGVVVAVIDSGACVTHPDLAGQIWTNPGEIPGNQNDDDNNGFDDDIVGWNFRDMTNDPFDDIDHGTHVAGTVAGDGTGGTQTGVAPDAELMILKIFGDFSAESLVWDAMQYSVANGADLMTASLGWPAGTSPDRSMWRTVCDNTIAAGVVVIYIGGNEGNVTPPDSIRTPGDVPSVITIGATDCSDVVADFSSLGPVTWSTVSPFFDFPIPPGLIKPTVAAPGVDTVSTAVDCATYSIKSGTSMAAPHTAGAVALMLEANPALDHAAVKALLVETAIDLGPPGTDNTYGAGRIDALAAVIAASRMNPDLNDDLTVSFADLLILLANWGPCGSGAVHCPGDLNRDGTVTFADVLLMIGAWGVL